MTADQQVARALLDDDNNHHSTADSTDNNDSTTYRELISFLSSPRSDLRKAAVEATLASLTSSNEDDVTLAARHLTSHNAIVPLCRIASIASNSDVKSNDALAALAILCSHPIVGDQCIHDFMDDNNCRGIGRMLEIALSNPPPMLPTASSSTTVSLSTSISSRIALECNEWRERVNYACALLANAVRTERGAVDFVGRSFPDEAIPSTVLPSSLKNRENEQTNSASMDTKPTATLLLSRFLNPAYIDTSSPGYKRIMEAWNHPKLNVNISSSGGGGGCRREKALSSYDDDDDPDLDDYDSDLDITVTLDDTLQKKMSLSDSKPSSANHGESTTTTTEGIVEYYDPYQHVAAVIMNITQLEKGRDFLMKLTSYSSGGGGSSNAGNTSRLQSLLPQLTSPNPSRRRGIAGTLKNCCFSQDSIWWLLNVVHIDKALLMTLAGPEELTMDEKVGLDPDYWLLGPQKHREPDALVRLYVAEAILLLLSSGGRRARETLRERRTYVIIKLADMVEEDERVSERLLECVQYLRRDEEGTEEGSSDRRAYEKYARGMVEMDSLKNHKKMVGSYCPALANNAEGDDDYDNID